MTRRDALTGALLSALLVLLGFTAPTQAARYTGSYSQKYAGKGYSYRYYRYYSRSARSYRSHMAVYYPSRPRYVYYYNPYTKKYWGRFDVVSRGYSKLADRDKAATLGQVPESAFPQPGQMPAPEPGGDDLMLPPPESLPPQGGGTGNSPRLPSKPGCRK